MSEDETAQDAPGRLTRIKGQAKSLRQTLVGAFGVMIVALTVANALSYAYSMVMTRMLHKEGAFGAFYSLNSLFLIVTIGAMALQAAITKFVAEFEAKGEQANIRVLLRTFSKWLIWAGAAIMIISAAVAWPLSKTLKLDSPVLLIILGSSIAVTLFLTLPFGLLQGRQKFVGLGVASIAGQVLRILFGVILVLIGFGVYGAIGAATIAAVLIAVVIIYYYRDLFMTHVEPVEGFHPAQALWFLLPVAITTFFIIFMTQIDVVLVKALFSQSKADAYSYGALAGKAVFFFPEGICVVMFPRVSELRARGRPTRRVLVLSVVAGMIMVGAVVAFYALFPSFSALFFAGEKGRKAIGGLTGLFGIKFVVLFGIVMAIFALVKLLAFYHLALERKLFILVFVAAGAAEIVGILLFHGSLPSVLAVMLIVGLALLVVNLVLALVEKPGPERSDDEDFSDPAVLPIK